MTEPTTFMPSHHEPGLVAVSVLIAIVASYAALDLAGRVTAAKGRMRALWLGGGALAMGVGIWSMHYIAMLAFHLPVPVLYDLPTVALSLLAASVASAIALWVVSRPGMGLAQAIPGSVVMGTAIATMHYTGMAAMRLPAIAHYDPALVALSVAIAIVVSFVALCLAFYLRGDLPGLRRTWGKLGSAALMGAAIPSMHYTAMAAVHYQGMPIAPSLIQGTGIPSLGTTAITLISLIVLGMAILTAFAERRMDAQAAASEGARQAQDQFLRDVIDASPHLVFARDAEGQYVMANKAYAQWCGFTPEQLVGRHDVELRGAAEDLERFLRQDREVILTGVPQTEPDVKATHAQTNETRWFEVVKVPLRSLHTTDTLSLTIATDITHRRVLEEQLGQSQKMEAVGLLAGGVAHDFNNMLTAIMGRTDLLLDEPAPTEQQQGDLLEIRRAAERAASLTKQLLAFSRRQVLQPKVFDLNTLVGDVLSMLRRMIGADVELDSVAGSPLATIKADPSQIEQVVMNLVVNARDAMPQGGKLTLETSDLTIAAGTPQLLAIPAGRYVVLSVSDTGVGMSQEVKTHIFEPFFTTKKAGQGTGLGLATVYGVVKQSGGHISVYSEPGRGTTFKIYFPRVGIPSTARVETISDALARLRGTETILVVEDEDVVRRVTCTMLGRRGYRILVASTGEEALQLAEYHQGPIHLLLTDVVMPRMGGRELAERLRPLRPELRVLFFSGYTADAGLHQDVLEDGVPFLQKPFTPDGLALKVREILDAGIAATRGS